MLRIVSTRVVDVELPGFAKKALKPTNTMVQTDEWSRAGRRIVVRHVRGGSQGCAGAHLGHDGSRAHRRGLRHDVALDLQVKVPIVGGKIADWVGKKDVQRTLDAEFDFNAARLASR